jgi:hypothetical protein
MAGNEATNISVARRRMNYDAAMASRRHATRIVCRSFQPLKRLAKFSRRVATRIV